MKYAIQLYSVRDFTEKDFDSAIEMVAKLGYSAVEFAGFFDRTPEQVLSLLQKNNLENYGAHASFNELMENYNEVVAFHKAIGTKYFVIPVYDLSSREKIDNFIKQVNEIQPRLAKDGITLAYHNHAFEFKKNEDGSVPYAELVNKTALSFQVDVFWAYVGTGKPLEVLKALKDRVCSIHMKDGIPGGEGNPLGQGCVPLKEIYAFVKEQNIPLIVESETCCPDGMTEAKICIEYLKSL